MKIRYRVRLGTDADAPTIARLSRDTIEHGLEWRYTPTRVLTCMRAPDTNVIAIDVGGRLAGFAIMEYSDETAHLVLLAVAPGFRRRGIAAALVDWLEVVALNAGIDVVNVETRASNRAARDLYRRLGYRELKTLAGYYQSVEDAIRLTKTLRVRR